MKERPILMNAFSVKAILDGRKTQTRRVIKPQPPEGHWWAETPGEMKLAAKYYPGDRGRKGCPYGVSGDRLWVRETWRFHGWRLEDGEAWIEYRATPGTSTFVCDDSEGTNEDCDRWERYMLQCTDDAIKAGYDPDADWWEREEGQSPCRWRPSIFMPRWASRITLEVTGVRVERLQDISPDDLRAEGCPAEYDMDNCNGMTHAMYGWFEALWDSINGKKHPWESNPWVWVVEFQVLEP